MYSARNLENIKQVYDDTQKHADEYDVEQSEKIFSESIIYTPMTIDDKKILVIHDSPYAAAVHIWRKCNTHSSSKFKLGMLCVASNSSPITQSGTGASTGAEGYEFDLLRLSNLSLTIDGGFYPMMHSSLDAIVCPKISIFRDITNYEYCDPVPITAIFMSCQRNPQLVTVEGKEQYSSPADKQLMNQKIENVFKTASMYGINCLIISDFGTSLHHNHPVAGVIEMINSAYKKYPIERVIIAIKTKIQPEQDKIYTQYHYGITRT